MLEKYRQEITNCLLDFQYIEVSLKMILYRCESLIQKRTSYKRKKNISQSVC